MNKLVKKIASRDIRKSRIRSRVNGTQDRPRLTVKISNLHISAQIIDDEKMTTLVQSSTVGQTKLKGSLTEKAEFIGHEIGKKAIAAKINKVVFDRNGRKYHGRIKALADAVRAEGLEF